MIDHLTPEQEAQADIYKDKWRAVACRTEPIKAEDISVMLDFLAIADIVYTPEQVKILPSPLAIGKVLKEAGWSVKDITDCRPYQRGNMNAGYCGYYDFLLNVVMPEKQYDEMAKYIALCQCFHCFWLTDDVIYCSEFPVSVELDDEGYPNAFTYKDGWGAPAPKVMP